MSLNGQQLGINDNDIHFIIIDDDKLLLHFNANINVWSK